MRSRPVILAAVVIAAASALFTVSRCGGERGRGQNRPETAVELGQLGEQVLATGAVAKVLLPAVSWRLRSPR